MTFRASALVDILLDVVPCWIWDARFTRILAPTGAEDAKLSREHWFASELPYSIYAAISTKEGEGTAVGGDKVGEAYREEKALHWHQLECIL